MKRQWFIYHRDQVMGPFSPEEIQQGIESGLFHETSMVWGKGMKHWLHARSWRTALPDLLNRTEPVTIDQQWYYATDGQSHGPLSRSLLIQKLSRLEDVRNVLLWTKGLQNWLSILEFHDFMEELSLNRREFPRAPLTGEALLYFPTGEARSHLLSVSAGGIGVSPSLALSAGERIQVRMTTPIFPGPLTVICEVKYVSSPTYAGLEFQNLGAEEKSMVLAYVASFLSKSESRKAA